MPTYIEQVLDINKTVTATYVAFLSFTAPLSGIVIGGIITSYFGGYNSY